MADFDTFVSVAPVGINNEDPAAEFLAREQNVLAELDDDFDFARTNADISSKLSESYANGDSDEYHQLNGPMANGTEDNENGDAITSKMNSSSPKYVENIIPREEPEKIRKWREEQQRLLEQKDADEARKKDELRQSAKHELEEWYTRYSEQLEKSKINNRNAEKEWVAERDTEVPGLEWEKIARMCDFNPKSTRNTKDTSRMRSILLQLKQNPPVGSNSKS